MATSTSSYSSPVDTRDESSSTSTTKDCFSVETLDEWVKEMLPELLGEQEAVKSVLADPQRLIAHAPFFEHPIADSVAAFVSRLRVELSNDWCDRLEPLVGKSLRSALTAGRTKASLKALASAPEGRARSRVRSKPSARRATTSSTKTKIR